MTNQVSALPAKSIGKYLVASADMYFSEEEQREIYLCDDPEQGLMIWGETPACGATASIGLCQIFLEYGLFCQTLHHTDQCYKEMRSFGESLGANLADYIQDMPRLHGTPELGACALETILKAIHADLTIERMGTELRFVVAGCPVLDASQNTGLTEIELAQFGFNMMCQRVIQLIDPDLILNVSTGNERGQVFTLIKSNHPTLEPSY